MTKENPKRNLYDFDGTIYDGNCSVDFFIYCLVQNPKLIKYIPQNLKDLLNIKLKRLELEHSQTNYCQFLTDMRDLEILILKFWKQNLKKIKTWYLEQKQESDIIITTSPSFLINPICSYLNIQAISTIINQENGEILELCYRGKKLEMLNKDYKDVTFDRFYTDNLSDDECLSSKAKQTFLVKGNKRIKLPNFPNQSKN